MRSPTSWQNLLRPGDAVDFFLRARFPPFDPTDTNFSAANALWLAELSRLSYRGNAVEDSDETPTRTQFLAAAGFEQLAFFESKETDTQGMLVQSIQSPTYTVLVFRGTEQKLKDFVTDLRIGSHVLASDSAAVHRGFQIALDSVWPSVKASLADVPGPLFFAGHSLGGALATLSANRIAPDALYTFGCPRVGNMEFVAKLEGLPHYRIVDDWDLVPLLPPEILGFEHAGEAIELNETSIPFSFNPWTWMKLILSPTKPLADHAPVNYVDRLAVMMNTE